MSKKLDDKVLELLKDQVIQRDRELEKKQVHESTKEALAEMTSLSRKEVDTLYAKLRQDAYKQQRKRNIIFGVIIAVLLIAGLIVANKIFNPPAPPRVFVEEFENTVNGWDLFDVYVVKSEIKNGVLDFETFEKDGYIRDIETKFKFPKNYDITLKTEWLAGSLTEAYGLQLTANENNFGYFYIRQDGKARYGFKQANKWVTDIAAVTCEKMNLREDVSNILKIKVRGDRFSYFVNDEEVYKSSMLGIKMTGLKIICAATQHVSFDYIKVTAPNSDKILLQEDFNDNNREWATKIKAKKKTYIKDGKFYFIANKKDYCYWTDIPLPEYNEYEIEATVGFQSGEKDDFGLMLSYDSKNYYAFEINEDGEARLLVNEKGEFTFTGEYQSTNQKTNPDNSVILRIRVTEEDLEYYVNKTLVDKRKRYSDYFYLREIGVRNCGEQTVYFDNIKITEIL